jgi:hypothetical protein
VDHKWNYKLTTHSDDASAHKSRKVRDQELPPFSPGVFLEHLVRFVVADDQVRLNDLVFFHHLTDVHLFSLFVSSNAPSFDSCVWFSASPSSMLTSLAAIK